MALSITACGGDGPSTDNSGTKTPTPESDAEANQNVKQNDESSGKSTTQETNEVSPNEPMMESLLDGILIPEKEASLIEERAPLAVIFDNHIKARPVSGLDQAELVYELVVEAGVTRMVGLFWRNDVEKLIRCFLG